MTRRRFSLAVAGLTASRLRAQEQTEATFSSDVRVVNLLATVRDKRGAFVRDLGKDDFTLLEDGRPQTIRYFAKESDLPLTIGLMIDTSMSQVHVMDAERGASFRFLDSVLREHKDHVFITLFDMNVRAIQPLTSSRRDLDGAMVQVDTPTRRQLESQIGGGTLLFDAVIDATRDVMRKQQGRKALIILSDGGDNGSEATLSDAIDATLRTDTVTESIFFSDGAYGSGQGKRNLERMAKDTGGSFFEVSKKLSIDQVFGMIEEELRSQYSIGYVSDRPEPVSAFRKLQLAVKKPGFTVHTRDRYWAGPTPSGAGLSPRD